MNEGDVKQSRTSSASTIAVATVRGFIADKPFQLAAALSYYTLLSIAPLILVVIGVAGFLLGEAEVRTELVAQTRDLVGAEGAALLQSIALNVGPPRNSIISMVVGTLLTLLGASTVFAQLQVALNRIWHVEPAPANAMVGFLRARVLSLTVVLGLGFMLLVSLVISAMLAGFYTHLDSWFPGAGLLSRLLNVVASIGLIALLLAMLFRYVPDARVSWRDTIVGALVTAVLFTLGKYAIGLYLGQASIGSAYGAAGSAVVFMVWVYYASLILFFGAELTKVAAEHRGKPVVPSIHARSLDAS